MRPVISNPWKGKFERVLLYYPAASTMPYSVDWADVLNEQEKLYKAIDYTTGQVFLIRNPAAYRHPRVMTDTTVRIPARRPMGHIDDLSVDPSPSKAEREAFRL